MNKLCVYFFIGTVAVVAYNLFSVHSTMNEVEKVYEQLQETVERKNVYIAERDIELERVRMQVIEQEIECLARNMYFEARGEGQSGVDAVAFVTINRVRSNRYPNTICEVVYQARRDSNGNPIRHKCQFSWYCDGRPDNVQERYFTQLYRRAEYVYINYYLNKAMVDTTRGSTHYHTTRVSPHWSRHRNYQQVANIGDHVFYRPTY